MQRDMLPVVAPHPQLEPIEPIQLANALQIDEPPSRRSKTQPHVAKSRPRTAKSMNSKAEALTDLSTARLRRYHEAPPELAQRQARAQPTRNVLQNHAASSRRRRASDFFRALLEHACLSSERSATRR